MPEKKIYLDYAATTPVDPRVFSAMRPYFTSTFGNAGSVHSYGQSAISALDRARETVAGLLGVSFREIIFTSGATEANNLALRGAVALWRAQKEGVPRIIISSIEHESVLKTAEALEREGVEVIRIPVRKDGFDMKALREALGSNTVLISVMYVNNETGEVLPVREIGRVIREARIKSSSLYPMLHTDASQAWSYLPVRPEELGADLVTLSGHKACGPKGVGALYVKEEKNSRLEPIYAGGGQEFGFRSGTENVPLIVGLGEALKLADSLRARESVRVGELSRRFFKELKISCPKIELNSPKKLIAVDIYEGICRAPHILNIYVPYAGGEELLTALDMAGIAVSHGSACSARSLEPSVVLRSKGWDEERAKKSIRVSFGRMTTLGEVKAAVKIISTIIKKYA